MENPIHSDVSIMIRVVLVPTTSQNYPKRRSLFGSLPTCDTIPAPNLSFSSLIFAVSKSHSRCYPCSCLSYLIFSKVQVPPPPPIPAQALFSQVSPIVPVRSSLPTAYTVSSPDLSYLPFPVLSSQVICHPWCLLPWPHFLAFKEVPVLKSYIPSLLQSSSRRSR